nr:hypothetical protein [uncultured Leptotrichia sp.]
MKKLVVLAVLVLIASCTAEDRMLWNEVQREKKERGRVCTYNSRGGLQYCEYER